MTSPPWVRGGYYSVSSYNLDGTSLTVCVPQPHKYAQWFINVNPVSATRKYTFKFNVLCYSLDGKNTQNISAKVYYVDPASGETILLWQSSKSFWNDHYKVSVERTVTFPETFQSSTGRIVCYIENNTDNSNAFISVYNLHITDMTTADLDNSLSKLGDRIQGFFDNLIESIKGFFIPQDGFFETVKQKFDTLLSEHLGFLYEAPEMVVTIFNTVKDWSPPEEPTITLPAFDFDIGENHIHLWDEKVYTFDFLKSQPWSTLYAFYKTFIFVFLSVAMINLAIKKYHSIIGGGESDDS